MGDFAEATGFVGAIYWPIAPLEDNGFASFLASQGLVKGRLRG